MTNQIIYCSSWKTMFNTIGRAQAGQTPGLTEGGAWDLRIRTLVSRSYLSLKSCF